MHVQELEWIEPIEDAQRLSDRKDLLFLDSAMRHDTLGRYSYVAWDPFATLTIGEKVSIWNETEIAGCPWQLLRARLATFAQDHLPSLPPFQGGAAGFFSYDLSKTIDSLAASHRADASTPLAVLNFYDILISYDHQAKRRWIISTGWPETDRAARDRRARQRAEAAGFLLDRQPAPALKQNDPVVLRSNFSREGYEAAVKQVIDLILRGDVFQVNIAQRFSASLPDHFDAFSFYCRLRLLNPAPFAAFLRFGDLAIASSSPERLIKLHGRNIEARPIKGTIARSDTDSEDRQRATLLRNSEKDRAENTMIVDLLRNDLSRVSSLHSIEVPVLCGLESYDSVHHLVSAIQARLAEGYDAVDLLMSCFPGGSITGAPKIKAMEIIADIEHVARGVYCGAIGFIGFDGTMDANIAIRTVVINNGEATFHAGGGITALSDPQFEYAETLAKAQRLIDALGSVPTEPA